MALSIKSPKTHALARQLASLTGESITEAVTVALQERTARLRADKGWLTNRLLEIGRDSAARIPEHLRSVDHGALLYDERGLPR